MKVLVLHDSTEFDVEANAYTAGFFLRLSGHGAIQDWDPDPDFDFDFDFGNDLTDWQPLPDGALLFGQPLNRTVVGAWGWGWGFRECAGGGPVSSDEGVAGLGQARETG